MLIDDGSDDGTEEMVLGWEMITGKALSRVEETLGKQPGNSTRGVGLGRARTEQR